MASSLEDPQVSSRPINAVVILTGCYLTMAPVVFPPLAWEAYDKARVFQLVFLWTLALVAVIPQVSAGLAASWLQLRVSVRASIVIFLVAGAISAVVSNAPGIGALQVGLACLLLGLVLHVRAAVLFLKHRAEAILAVAISSGVTLLVLKFWMTYWFYRLEGSPFLWSGPFLDFANARFFGQYQSYTLILVLLPGAVLGASAGWRVFLSIVAVNFWALQWILNSRAVWIGFFTACLFVALLATHGRTRWLLGQGVLVLGGGLISLLLTAQAPDSVPARYSLAERGAGSINERVVILESAARMTLESPLVGVGPGQFGLHYSGTLAAHPHNSPVQWLVENGALSGGAGIFLLGAIVLVALRLMRGPPTRGTDPVSVSLAAALVMGLTDALFSGNLAMPHSQILFCVLSGWLLARVSMQDGVDSPSLRSAETLNLTRTALVGVTLGALGVTAVLAFEYLSVVGEMRAIRIPNFWQYGRFGAW